MLQKKKINLTLSEYNDIIHTCYDERDKIFQLSTIITKK